MTPPCPATRLARSPQSSPPHPPALPSPMTHAPSLNNTILDGLAHDIFSRSYSRWQGGQWQVGGRRQAGGHGWEAVMCWHVQGLCLTVLAHLGTVFDSVGASRDCV